MNVSRLKAESKYNNLADIEQEKSIAVLISP
jgi:hypothetical protein